MPLLNRSNSSIHQPLTMLRAQRPWLMRSRLEAIFATTCGVTMPGCTATMALRHHGQRGSEDPGGEIGTEKALGDQSCVEPKFVSAADHVVCELKGSICAARETGARFDLRDGAIHSGFGPDGVRQRSPDSEFHRASGYDLAVRARYSERDIAPYPRPC